MYAFTVTFAILCILPASIRSQTVSQDGQHPWCGKKTFDPSFIQAPEVCCTAAYKCNVFIKPHSTAYGIKNTSPWEKRLCTCDVEFGDCLLNNMAPMDAFKTAFLLRRGSCMFCPTGQNCEQKYEVINFGNWLTEQNHDDDDD